ncbi:hypothetical protein [Micromonospora sp. 4G55]|uniref:hypothetical protein n=1 Tax=Micromonospora sp. 4G55 TaxID=2806102 RepID=UPI001A3962E6|nr:hypothetical protein [Micromonospora sp. 4G55]MBM0257068.1 hypothetical protein [Micromonospora sp. 4G55]
MSDPTPQVLQLYCRVEVSVTDPAALTAHAVAQLRAADIDWSREEDDLASAVAELRGDPARALGSVADISRILDDVPGVEFRGGACRAEITRHDEPGRAADRP